MARIINGCSVLVAIDFAFSLFDRLFDLGDLLIDVSIEPFLANS